MDRRGWLKSVLRLLGLGFLVKASDVPVQAYMLPEPWGNFFKREIEKYFKEYRGEYVESSTSEGRKYSIRICGTSAFETYDHRKVVDDLLRPRMMGPNMRSCPSLLDTKFGLYDRYLEIKWEGIVRDYSRKVI